MDKNGRKDRNGKIEVRNKPPDPTHLHRSAAASLPWIPAPHHRGRQLEPELVLTLIGHLPVDFVLFLKPAADVRTKPRGGTPSNETKSQRKRFGRTSRQEPRSQSHSPFEFRCFLARFPPSLLAFVMSPTSRRHPNISI